MKILNKQDSFNQIKKLRLNRVPEIIATKNDLAKVEEFLDKNQHLLKSTEYRAKSYEEEILMMKEFIINRGKWMDDNIDTLSKWAN